MKRVLATLVAIVAVITGLGPATPASATVITRSYKVLTWNIAGEKLNNAMTSSQSWKVVTDAVVSLAKSQSADVIMLQEVCRGQYDDLKALLKSGGWYTSTTNRVKFANQRVDFSDANWCGGGDFGLAMFTKFEMEPGVTNSLPQATGDAESRKILCAVPTDDESTQLCVTHATNKSASVATQLSYIKSHIIDPGIASGVATILGGDLNAEPTNSVFDSWYSPSLLVARNVKAGTMVEAEQNWLYNGAPTYGEWTGTTSAGANHKIDYVWLSSARTIAYSGDVVSTPTGCTHTKTANLPPSWTDTTSCSDHRPLIGSIATGSESGFQSGFPLSLPVPGRIQIPEDPTPIYSS